MAAMTENTDVVEEKVNHEMADFYDETSEYLEDTMGVHWHHGFYDSTNVNSDPHSAQIRMIEAALRFASISDDPLKKPRSIVDVGCGIGGSARYLAGKYDAQCTGITLSPFEARRAHDLAVAEGLESKVSFEVADALNQPFPDGQFDLVWCMESAEHMPDKTKFVHEMARVAAPGATIIITIWCHRDLSPFEQSLHPDENKLLDKISTATHTSTWCSKADYLNLLKSLSLQNINSADWSQHVTPFWSAMMKSSFSWKGIMTFVRGGLKSLERAKVMPLLSEGYKKGLIKYCIITCQKPE